MDYSFPTMIVRVEPTTTPCRELYIAGPTHVLGPHSLSSAFAIELSHHKAEKKAFAIELSHHKGKRKEILHPLHKASFHTNSREPILFQRIAIIVSVPCFKKLQWLRNDFDFTDCLKVPDLQMWFFSYELLTSFFKTFTYFQTLYRKFAMNHSNVTNMNLFQFRSNMFLHLSHLFD